MALTPKQIEELNAAAARVAANKAGVATATNAGDIANLAYAAKQGYVAPTIRDGTDILIPNTQNTSSARLASMATPGSTGLDQWKSGANLVEAARSIIQMKQGQNADLQSAKKVWEEKARSTTPWEGDQKIFQGMSPADQASIRSKQYATAQAHLSSLVDEEKYRASRTEDTLGYISDIYKEKVQELKDQRSNANEEERLQIDRDRLKIEQENSTILNSQRIYDSGLPFSYDKTGKLVYDDSQYDMPEVGSKVQVTGTGPGTLTGYGSDKWQYGLDIAFDGGKTAQVKAPFDATVLWFGSKGGFGQQVQVKNNATGEVLWISHLSNIADLKVGQTYKAGTTLGTQGNTGSVIASRGGDGTHVDFTMPNGDGTYKSAAEVALALGIGSAKTTTGSKDLTYLASLTDTDVKTLQSLNLTKAELDLAISIAEANSKKLSGETLQTEGDQKIFDEADAWVITQKGQDPNLIHDSLIRKYGKSLVLNQLDTIMTKAGYKWDTYTSKWK